MNQDTFTPYLAAQGSLPDQGPRVLQFVSDAAHEIVSPVNQVASLVALFVSRYGGKLDADAQHLLNHIESAGARAALAASGLRAYFRILSADLDRSLVDTRAALDAALAEIEPEILACNAEIDCGDLPPVQGDARLLSQFFRLVIQNSLQFAAPHTPPRIVICAEPSSKRCLFSISDNGIGIDPAHRESVFEAFAKLAGHSSPGAGMGLTQARAIAELQGGRVWIGDPRTTGATVYLELPAAIS